MSDDSVIYKFGGFRVDTLKRQLFRGESAVPLTSKAFDTLATLVESRGETISKSDLMNAVWGEAAVEENNLTQQISILRKALGERAGDHQFIVTVSGRGYCFVAPVVCLDRSESQQTLSRRSVFRALWESSFAFGYGLGIVYVMAVCVTAFFLDWQSGTYSSKPQSIAILKFRSAAVGDDLLGMGIRDTLRAKLGSLDDVTVRPDTVELQSNDVVDTGRKLNVDVVLTGSVQRDVDRVRVVVEMVDVTNERVLWGSTFDESFSHTFELQDSIVNAVVGALKRPRSTGELRKDATPQTVVVDLPEIAMDTRRTFTNTTYSI